MTTVDSVKIANGHCATSPLLWNLINVSEQRNHLAAISPN
jgi:hypothetical protein